MSFLDSMMVVAMQLRKNYIPSAELMWNPELKVDFHQLDSSMELSLELTQPSQLLRSRLPMTHLTESVSLSVFTGSLLCSNHTFSTQQKASMFLSRSNPGRTINAEFYCNPKSKEMNEYFVLDVFVVTQPVSVLASQAIYSFVQKCAHESVSTDSMHSMHMYSCWQ